MNEEKMKILDLLKEGKITSEEAIELLKHVGDDNNKSRRNNWQGFEQWIPHNQIDLDLSWINDLCEAVKESTINVFHSDNFTYGTTQEKYVASLHVNDNINMLQFEGKNAPIKLETYNGDQIEVEAHYKIKNRFDPHLSFTEENGIYHLNYDDNALYTLGIHIRVPETTHIDSVRLKNKNSSIVVGGIQAKKIELRTMNSTITVSDTKGESLYCETKNSSITLNRLQMKEIDAQTSHSMISLNNVKAYRARLMTSNFKIDIKNSDIVQIYARTSNSPLHFECLGISEQEPVCTIEAITTNGQISINLPHNELKCRLHASTTAGGILSEFNDLVYQVNDKNYVDAQEQDYDLAQNKLNLNLQTTNYGIYIKK